MVQLHTQSTHMVSGRVSSPVSAIASYIHHVILHMSTPFGSVGPSLTYINPSIGTIFPSCVDVLCSVMRVATETCTARGGGLMPWLDSYRVELSYYTHTHAGVHTKYLFLPIYVILEFIIPAWRVYVSVVLSWKLHLNRCVQNSRIENTTKARAIIILDTEREQ